MGLWYKAVGGMPLGEPVFIPAQVGAPPKRWWNFWRFRQKWFVLKVPEVEKLLYFKNKSEGTMVLRAVIPKKIRLVAVRVGPEDHEFLVTNLANRNLWCVVCSGPYTLGELNVMSTEELSFKHHYLGPIYWA